MNCFDVNLGKEEIEEIKKEAHRFKINNLFRLPCIFKGNKVASRNLDSKITNFSTITKCFSLSTGKWIYLVYAYPFSVIHRFLDGVAKWATGKYCIKEISRKKWEQEFVRNSFIPIIPVGIPNLVAMPYIENENLFDILAGRIGSYTFSQKKSMIMQAIKIIKEMHVRGTVWGELIVQNMIRAEDGEVIICDTETRYYKESLSEQKASDWLDFICSAAGSVNRLHSEEIDNLVCDIMNEIQEDDVRKALKNKCQKKVSWLHKLFFAHTKVRLACPKDIYDSFRKKIANHL